MASLYDNMSAAAQPAPIPESTNSKVNIKKSSKKHPSLSHRININLTNVLIGGGGGGGGPSMCPTAELDESLSFSLGSSMSDQSSLSFLADLTSLTTGESSTTSDFSFLSSSSSSSTSTCHSATRINIYPNSRSSSSDSSISLSSTLSATVPIETLAKDWSRKLLNNNSKHKSRREDKKSSHKPSHEIQEILLGSKHCRGPLGLCRISAIEFNSRTNTVQKKIFRVKERGCQSECPSAANDAPVDVVPPSTSSTAQQKDNIENESLVEPIEPVSSQSPSPPICEGGKSKKKHRKFKSLPRMTKFIEFVDIRRLPDRKSISYRDDTVENVCGDKLAELPSTSAIDMRNVINKLDLSFSTRIMSPLTMSGQKHSVVRISRRISSKQEEEEADTSSSSSGVTSPNIENVSQPAQSRPHEYERNIEECLETNEEEGEEEEDGSCCGDCGTTDVAAATGDTIDDGVSLSTRILSISNDVSPLNETQPNLPVTNSGHVNPPQLISSADLLSAQTPDDELNLCNELLEQLESAEDVCDSGDYDCDEKEEDDIKCTDNCETETETETKEAATNDADGKEAEHNYDLSNETETSEQIINA